jgi:hypothetical protein
MTVNWMAALPDASAVTSTPPHYYMEHACGDATQASLHGQVILHISIEDVLVTREIVQAGKLLDIDVLDHLVLGNGVWVSLRERGLGFDTR